MSKSERGDVEEGGVGRMPQNCITVPQGLVEGHTAARSGASVRAHSDHF